MNLSCRMLQEFQLLVSAFQASQSDDCSRQELVPTHPHLVCVSGAQLLPAREATACPDTVRFQSCDLPQPRTWQLKG